MGLSFRFIHAAELRLDEPIEGIGPLPESIAAEVRDASLAAFDRLVELALTERVAFVLLTGGIGAEPEHGLRAAIRLRDGLKRLTDEGIRVVLAVEDDSWLSRPPVEGWPESIVVFRPGMPLVQVTSTAGVLATIAWYSDHSAPTGEPGSLRVGLPPSGFAGELPEGFDYLAWTGRRDYAASDGLPLRLSPGTLQGRGFDPDERGAKGAALVSVDEQGAIEHEFVPLDAVRFVSVELVVEAPVPPSSVARPLAARLDALRSLHAGSPLIVEAVIDVRGSQAFPGGRPVAQDEILGLLREVAAGMDPFVWWARLRLRHRFVAAWEQADRPDDFVGGVRELAAVLDGDLSQRSAFIGRQVNAQELDALAQGDSVRQLIEQLRGEVAGSAELVGEAAELAVDALGVQPKGEPLR